jgi:hypothetical protein
VYLTVEEVRINGAVPPHSHMLQERSASISRGRGKVRKRILLVPLYKIVSNLGSVFYLHGEDKVRNSSLLGSFRRAILQLRFCFLVQETG